MAFDPAVHGMANSSYNYPPVPPPFSYQTFQPRPSLDTAEKMAVLRAKLEKQLGPEYVSTRVGPAGGGKLTYIEGWKAINLANEVFGFDGWASSITSLTVDYIDHNIETQKYNVGVTAIVRVTLRNGSYHEDVGYGTIDNVKQKGAALDKCKKEAVTDGVKRALRNFGNLLGNCLYDKNFAKEIGKMPVPTVKLDRSNLHRRPEYSDKPSAPAVPQQPAASSSSLATAQRAPTPPNVFKPELPPPAAPSTSTSATTSRNTTTASTLSKPLSRPAVPQPQNRPLPPANAATKPRSSSGSSTNASRKAAIEAAMADADPMEVEGLQPTRPSTPEANKKPTNPHDTLFSFGSEDDALFADINLECYNDLPGADDLTPGDEPSILPDSDDTTLVEEPAPPIVMGKGESSRPQLSKGVQRQPSGSNDAAIHAARTARRLNIFNSVISSSTPPNAESSTSDGVAGKKRSSDEMAGLQHKFSSDILGPVMGGFSKPTAPARPLEPPRNNQRAHSNPITMEGEGGVKRIRR